MPIGDHLWTLTTVGWTSPGCLTNGRVDLFLTSQSSKPPIRGTHVVAMVAMDSFSLKLFGWPGRNLKSTIRQLILWDEEEEEGDSGVPAPPFNLKALKGKEVRSDETGDWVQEVPDADGKK